MLDLSARPGHGHSSHSSVKMQDIAILGNSTRKRPESPGPRSPRSAIASINAAQVLLEPGRLRASGGGVALISATETLTYAGLTARVAAFAAGLRAAEVEPGDRVLLMLPDTPDFVALYLAVMAVGGVSVAVSTRATTEELRHILAIAKPVAVVVGDEFAESAEQAIGEANSAARLFLGGRAFPTWKAEPQAEIEFCLRRPADPAFWIMTSGTTGKPKAVEHRHDHVLTSADYFTHALGANAQDRVLVSSRLHFAYALGALFATLRLGASSILLEHWPTPQAIAAAIDQHAPTLVLSVPALYHKLLDQEPHSAAFAAVRHYVSAGERLNPKIADAWEQATGRAILDGLGCSETVQKIFMNAPDARRPGASGRPVPGVQVRLIGEDGTQILAAGQPGRLEVRMRSLFAGYRTTENPTGPALRPPEQFRDGWFATGDEYRMDLDGYYYHCGRSDDMLKIIGMWVSPFEIEDAVAGLPGIADAAAVAAENAAGLPEIVLHLVAVPGHHQAELIERARQHLACVLPPFKRPRQFKVVSELPRTVTGKIQRYKLRAAQAVPAAD
jgi:acyl-coenzyme A synthetase/AMP-(fatty) acid ligase